MRVGLALITVGVVMIGFFALELYNTNAHGAGFMMHQQYGLYFLVFGIGFTIIGISAISARVLSQLIQPSSQFSIIDSIRQKFSYSGVHSLPGTIDESVDSARAKTQLAHSISGAGSPLYNQELLLLQIIGIGISWQALPDLCFGKQRVSAKF